MPSQHGFTLIELMIVVAIIGLLAAIAIPAYQNYTARSQVAEALNMANAFKGEVVSYYGESGTCPTITGLGLPASGDLNGRYIDSLSTSTPQGAVCAITFNFKSAGTNSGLKNKHLTLAMLDISIQGSAQWLCSSEDIQQIYLPSTCRGI
ncbi:pilin [Alkanindiges sp. WGS2144]|uniref:pilin n=1 Tax=Alkanindiges sp. WGS2144 TaxID=3366808 RepID=UPI003753A478